MTNDLVLPNVKKGQELELTVESLAFGGQGVAKINDFVIFIDHAVPGQQLTVRIVKKRKSYAVARILDVIQQSDDYVEPICSHFLDCGGCVTQHYQYAEQIKTKTEQVKDIITRLGGFSDFEFSPTLPSVNTFYYRNKMEFSFARQRWITQKEIESGEPLDKEGYFLGMHARGFYEKVIDLKECHLAEPVIAQILSKVRSIAAASKYPAYSTQDHTGFWRFLVIRKSANTDDLMVNIVASKYDKEIAELLKTELLKQFPQITSLLFSTTKSKASVAFSEAEYVLHGKPVIYEKLGNYIFEISGNSFFQTNTKQAEKLYDVVLDYAEFKGNETVYDLYCGAGTISLYMSNYVNKVVGFEAIESAVQNAEKNATLNQVKNCEFVLGDLKNQIEETDEITSRYGKPDVLIIDPPRAGMHPKTVQAINRLAPQRIVHVSCNPTTLARDIKELAEDGYKLLKLQPVDMFPHTAHVEVVALLVKE